MILIELVLGLPGLLADVDFSPTFGWWGASGGGIDYAVIEVMIFAMGIIALGRARSLDRADFIAAEAAQADGVGSEADHTVRREWVRVWFLIRVVLFMWLLEALISQGLMNELSESAGNDPRFYRYGAGDTVPMNLPYVYGSSFLISFGGVPLWIPVGWGVIFFIVRETARRILDGSILRATLSTLLALNMDFALDPIAHEAGWWEWGVRVSDPGAPGGQQDLHTAVIFGIPVTNYVAWAVIVFAISLGWAGYRRLVGSGRQRFPRLAEFDGRVLGLSRRGSSGLRAFVGAVPVLASVMTLVTRRAANADDPLYPIRHLGWGLIRTVLALIPMFLALLLVVLIVGITYQIDAAEHDDLLVLGVGAVILSASIGIIVWGFPGRHDHPLDATLVALPLALYSVFIAGIVFTGLFQKDSASRDLAITMPLLAMVGMAVFAWPYVDDLVRGGALHRRIAVAVRGKLSA